MVCKFLLRILNKVFLHYTYIVSLWGIAPTALELSSQNGKYCSKKNFRLVNMAGRVKHIQGMNLVVGSTQQRYNSKTICDQKARRLARRIGYLCLSRSYCLCIGTYSNEGDLRARRGEKED
jgi:hypothetical protein